MLKSIKNTHKIQRIVENTFPVASPYPVNLDGYSLVPYCQIFLLHPDTVPSTSVYNEGVGQTSGLRDVRGETFL